MTDFTASNGIKVENFTHFSGLHRIIVEKNAKREIDVAVTADIPKALVEALDHERDEELGRWRWPENPDYVVYPKKESESAPQSGVRVVRESSGRSRDIERHVVDACEATVSVFGQAARAYFEAHPERKLPEENGVYVPASADLSSGPLTFVMYGGSWRATPDSDNAEELAREWHTRVGLARLGKTEVAS